MPEVPEPDVGEHDVLVEGRAASVKPLDVTTRDGEFRQILPYRVPFVLGQDMGGQVVRVGSAVQSFAPGDVVYARLREDRIGTFAELIAVPEDDLALKPSTLPMVGADGSRARSWSPSADLPRATVVPEIGRSTNEEWPVASAAGPFIWCPRGDTLHTHTDANATIGVIDRLYRIRPAIYAAVS
jgi:hypothetical protein